MLQLASMGKAIIVGRAGNVVTRRLKAGLHVRLIGSVAQRLTHIREFDKLDAKAARAFLNKEDKARRAYMKKYFDADIDDPLLYDLVLNTDFLAPAETAQLIADALRCKRRRR